MNCKLSYLALVAVSLIGSTMAASAQAGGANGVGAAPAPGSDVRAGEEGRATAKAAPGNPATTRKEIQDESQYTIGDKRGPGPGVKPDAAEAAPAGR